METTINLPKPKSVSNAIYIFVASLILGIVNSIVSEATTDFKNYSSGMGLFITIFVFGITAFFISQMNSGKKWARTTFLILFILGSIMFPFTITVIFKASPISGLLTIILTIMQIVALIMIYGKESSDWFNQAKKTNT